MTVMAKTTPFFGRVIVVPTEVAPVERPSGLIIPTSFSEPAKLSRGVIACETVWDDLDVGDVVWYFGNGWMIGDQVVLDPHQIVAVERS